MERMCGRGGVCGGVIFLITGRQVEQRKKLQKYNTTKALDDLRWPPFDILHATTNQKQAGVTEGGWDRPRNHARTLREHDGNNELLAEGNDEDNDKYNEDGDIPNVNDEYAVGLTVSTSPSTRATTSMKPSALPPHERALRVSGQACLHAESIIFSAGGAESMILSAHAESIILSALPAESMILSQRRPRASMP